MEIIRTIEAWQAVRATWQDAAGVGVIPTMGYLHAGHLSLVGMARQQQARVAVSIFVNPLQFGPSEDLAAYPRDEAHDLALLAAAEVDAVFIPSAAEMYPAGFATQITVSGPLTERLEGARRPGHYAGVATVVSKLFAIMRPTHAYFGQKDAQQLAVVRRFVADLNLPVQIIAGSIIREHDGLAMSSRNIYLSPVERAAALVLQHALAVAQTAINNGERRAEAIRAIVGDSIAAEPLATLDYVDVVDPATFLPLAVVQPPALLDLVVKIGKPRLLDNFLWRADGTWDVGVRDV